jgi:hypothetical protein
MAQAVKLFRIVDQHGRTYYSNRFKGYYPDADTAKNALVHLPKRVYVGWSEVTKRPMYEDADYTVQVSEITWSNV